MVALVPAVSQGEPPSGPINGRDLVKKGTVEAGFAMGWLQGEDVLRSPSSNRNAVYVLPRFGMVLTDELASGRLAGNLEVMVEPLYARYYQPFGANAAGATLNGKYNFLAFGRWMPFFELGAGMLWTNLAPRITEQSTPFNFVLQAGPGVQYFATERVALTLGARFHHISNAGIGVRNTGLNGVLPYVGVSYFLLR
jgi:hypothetical protein